MEALTPSASKAFVLVEARYRVFVFSSAFSVRCVNSIDLSTSRERIKVLGEYGAPPRILMNVSVLRLDQRLWTTLWDIRPRLATHWSH